MKILWFLVKRDLKRIYQESAGLGSLSFFLLCLLLFSLALSPSLMAFQRAGTLWIALIFAATLWIPSLFEADFQAGVLDQWLLQGVSPSQILMAKFLSTELVLLPLGCFGLAASFIEGMPIDSLILLGETLLLGLPIIGMLATLMATLTLGGQHPPGLIPLLILPLYIPVVIFSSLALKSTGAPGPFLWAMGTVLGLVLGLGPLLGAMALKDALEFS